MRKPLRLLWLLLLVPVALGLGRLRFDVDVLNLLPENLPEVRGLSMFQKFFSDSEELILTIKAPDPDRAAQAAESIAETLRDYASLIRRVSSAPAAGGREIAELAAFAWLNEPPEIFAEKAQTISGAELTNTLNEAKETLTTSFSPQEITATAYDPLGLLEVLEEGPRDDHAGGGMFSSADGTFRVLHVESAVPIRNYKEAQAFVEGVDILVELSLPPESRGQVLVAYTGGPAFISEIAGGMERDMTVSIGGTAVVVALLFGIAHRRLLPLLWLLFLLGCILAGTLALGGLLFGALNVVSLGFAAILLGLTADYGLVLYQEARVSGKPASSVRKEIGPGIIWSALTTAGAFWLLNFSSLPGLAQLGSLVGIGLLIGAAVMLGFYLGPLVRNEKTPPAGEGLSEQEPGKARRQSVWQAWLFTALAAGLAIAVLWNERPGFDSSPEALRPRHSPAYAAMAQLQIELGTQDEPLWMIVPGGSEQQVAERLNFAHELLVSAVSNDVIRDFTLPRSLWPNPGHQAANRDTAQALLRREENILGTMAAFDFITESSLTERVLDHWKKALDTPGIFLPESNAGQAVLKKIAGRQNGEFAALGLIRPPERDPLDHSNVAAERELIAALHQHGIIISSWDRISAALLETVKGELRKVLLPVGVLVIACLWLAFRRLGEVLLCFAALGFSGLALVAFMAVFGWSWNLMNLMAVPLLLGAGVDYCIHMILAMRRHHGNRVAVQRSVGRALLLCGTTTAAAFGSLSFSHNSGMASLGQVCSLGIVCMMLTAVFLLPHWRKV
jgi:uncharacterized protein